MSEGQTARNDHRYRTPPEAAKRPLKRKQSQGPARAFSGELKPDVSPRSLYWERVNPVTYKLCVRGRFSDTPASHGQWQGYRASFPVAWVTNIGWAVDSEAWLGRCRDKRGDWCLGPTTFEDARTQTKNWVLCLPVGGAADEWFLSNPIREYNELMALLARRRGESLPPPEEPEEFFQMKIECDDDYPVVAMLDDNTRVVESADRVQWIVQKKGEHVWNGVHFCPTKAELLLYARPITLEVLALPDQFRTRERFRENTNATI